MALDDGYVELSPQQRARIAAIRIPTAPRGPGDRSLLEWALKADARAVMTAFARDPHTWPGVADLALQLATARIARGPLPLVASPATIAAVCRWMSAAILDLIIPDDIGRTAARRASTITPIESCALDFADLWVRLRFDEHREIRLDPTDPDDEFGMEETGRT